MGRSQEVQQSESLPYERTAGGVAVDKLLFLQPQEFSSSGNRKWSALPDEKTFSFKNNVVYDTDQEMMNGCMHYHFFL